MGMRGDWIGEMGRISAIILLAAGVFLGVLPAEAAVWHVNAASTAANPDGQSWDTAYPSIQPAVNAAVSGDEVWVAKGTYVGVGTEVAKLKAAMKLYGGFAGRETVREQRDWNANVTVIDGEKARRCVIATQAAGAADGFTLQNGYASQGGGMYLGIAVNCVFKGNEATYEGDGGGGMFGGTAIGCTFTGNTAHRGGGLCRGTAEECTFADNTTTTWEYCYWYEDPYEDPWNDKGYTCYDADGQGAGAYSGTALNCSFTGNTAQYGGGMYDGTAVNCTFTQNTAVYGGGMREGTAINCILWGNSPDETFNTAVSYSCLSSDTRGTGNILGNPHFVNPWAGDFRLRADSPCIDTGTAEGAPMTDLLHRSRPQGAGVDMGAYEYHAGDDAGAVDPPMLRVDGRSTAANPDGMTWETAFLTLQDAADRAGYGSEIWVAEGNYSADLGKSVVTLFLETAVFGGFVGTETSREQRDAAAHPTIIDGQGQRRCVTANSSVSVDGITLQNGAAEEGGGMYSGTAVNCTFTGNTAKSGSGGMYFGTATNCTFTGNTAEEDGGGMCYGTAINCTFTGNTAKEDGGGIYCGTATNCLFTGNKARRGGGMDDGTATNCTFTQNTAVGDVLHGGVGGGMDCGTAVNCTFTQNTADYGGGMGGGYYGGTAVNCTFTRNMAKYDGGGMIMGTATNCIVWGNSPSETAGTDISYSCLSVDTSGTANIAGNPGFVNPWAGDFRLRADSPCIDIGIAEGTPSKDLLGRPRPHGAGVDIGAYEYYAGDETEAVNTPPVLRVDGRSTAANPDGLTWETAFPTLQTAANRSGYGGEIWVAEGAYTAAGGEAVVNLLPATSLFGGFLGSETIREQRDNAAHPVTIDGQGARRCVTADTASSIDGFILQDGTADNGGGMLGGSAVNCTFTGNTAISGGGGIYYGTAVNCKFMENTAKGDYGKGGGMYNGTATNCMFTGNSTGEYGGGMYSGTATNCTFTGNTAGQGGGTYSGTATNCTFTGNSARDGGGKASGTAVNCTFTANTAQSVGGMYYGTATNCILWGNAPGEIYNTIVSYCCLSTGVSGVSNIAGDPLFVNAAAGDFRLQPGSPCVNTGTAEGAPATDIVGVPRPQGAGVDIGAYETPVPVSVPDVTGLERTAAHEVIVAAQLYVRHETEQYHPTIPAGHVSSQEPAAGTQTVEHMPVDLIISKGPQPIPVPDVVGQTQWAAAAAIVDAGVTVGTVSQAYSATVPAGSVISQTPPAGTEVPPGTPVDLVVSKGVQPAVMPDVVGQPHAQAEATLADAGLMLGLVTQDHSATVPVGSVMAQSPPAGTALPPGTVVSIVVSLGPVPVVEGEGETVTVDMAREQLASAFIAADANGDGTLSFEEATVALPGLTQEVFNELDTDGDGQLSEAELGIDSGCGCSGCQGGKGDFGFDGWGRGLRELFVLGLGLTGLLAIGGRRT